MYTGISLLTAVIAAALLLPSRASSDTAAYPPTSSVYNLDERMGLSDDYKNYNTEDEYINSLLEYLNENTCYKLTLCPKPGRSSYTILYADAYDKYYREPDFIVAVISYSCDENNKLTYKDIIKIHREELMSVDEICNEPIFNEQEQR